MESASIKDITFLTFTVIGEFMGEYYEYLKITEEVACGLRILIGALIHMIEMIIVFFSENRLNTSKTFTPVNGVSKHGLIITVFILVLVFLLASIVYLLSAILNRKKENFDFLINKRKNKLLASFLKISSILFLLFKALSIVVSSILVANSTETGATDKIDSFFAAYSSIDLVISIIGLTLEFLRFIFIDLICYNKFHKNKVAIEYIRKIGEEFVLFDASRSIKWHPIWHEFEKDKHKFDELYHETYVNFCLSTTCCCFMCCSITGKRYAKKALILKQNIESANSTNDILESLKNFKKYQKRTNVLNVVFKSTYILFILAVATVTGYFIGSSFYKPENECPGEYFGSSNDGGFELNALYSIRYVQINSIKKGIICEKEWLRIMNKYDYPLDDYQRYSYGFSPIYKEYLNGFGFESNNYWMSLNDMNYLTNKQNRKLRIVFGNETFTDYIEYSLFKVKSAEENYKLELGSMTESTFKNVPDWSGYHSGMNFQANNSAKCSSKWRSGWWFNDCFGICSTCFNGSLYDSNNRLNYFKQIRMLIR